MTIIEQIKAEIERLKGQLIRGACAAQIEMETNCKEEAYNEVLSFLDTLEPEKPAPKDLEEAANNYLDGVYGKMPHSDLHIAIFIAGAKWQADHTPLPEDTVLFNKGVEEGKRLMMEEAVEGFIFQSEDYYPKELVARYNGELKHGDKVRVIVLKKED